MRRVTPLLFGFLIGFGIIAATVSAGALFAIGVGGHFLVRRDESIARNLSFDPSTVAARSPFPAAVALALFIVFVVAYLRMRRRERRYEQELRRITQTPGSYPGVERRRSMQIPPVA